MYTHDGDINLLFILVVSTLVYKACAKPKDVINIFLGALEVFFNVGGDSPELQQPQITRGEVLYRLEGST